MKLLETIRFENGGFANLELHEQRMNASRKELFDASAIRLEDELSRSSGFAIRTQLETDLQSEKPEIANPTAPDFQITNLKEPDQIFKCRIIYSKKIESIEFIPYQLPIIKSLKIVVADDIDYSRKYLKRSRLDKLYSQKGNCDDILMVKNGLITDTSFANILFFNGKEWLTPAQPMLKGTQRQFLLETEKISTADIRPADLKYFQKARLVNAMVRFEDKVDILLNRISSTCNDL